MKKHWFVMMMALSVLALHLKAQSGKHAEVQLMGGMNRGFGMGTNLVLNNLSDAFPFELRFGVGYTWLNPGNSGDARHIFINDATNGTPEKKGHNLDLRMDLMKPTTLFGNKYAYWYFGPRYSFFKGNFKYVGGNEDFDVTTKQFGLGTGLESRYQMTNHLKFVISAGLDYFLPSVLTGHDTSYSPDNDNVNTRTNQETGEKFKYKDADKAIQQPALMPRIQMGIQWEL